MRIIEPCCAQRDLRILRDSLGSGGSTVFEGYGDLSLAELLPALLMRYSETELLIAAPSLPDQAAEVIARWMRKQWARMDGIGKLDAVSRLTIVADLDKSLSPMASGWLEDNPFGERLTLVDSRQEDTVILLPDFAITGPVNMRYGHRFTATATNVRAEVEELWERYATVQEKEKKEEEEKEPGPVESPVTEESADAAGAAVPDGRREPDAAVSVPGEEPAKKEEPGVGAGHEEAGGDADQTSS